MPLDLVAGRFALCDPLATGGSGTVWRAWDMREGRYCAAKVLRQRDSGDLIRFTREQGVRLAHPHLLTPYSWVAEDAHVLIASELAAGGSAATLLGDWGALDPATVADVLDQLLDGLSHVHEMGLVHRDVKLGNVLLDDAPGRLHVRLADFGIALRASDARLTQLGHVMGTPGYLSPEARRGGAPTAAQDLYAAGVCALALVRGEEPAEATAADAAGVPGPLGATIAALLSADPADRPASAAAARATLRAGAVAEPRTATGDPLALVDQLPPYPDGWTRGGPVDGARPARRRRRAPVYVAAAVTLAIAGVGLGVQLLANGADPGRSPASHSTGRTSGGSGGSATTVTPSPVTAGAVCTWQQEGNEVTVSGVTLRCTRSGSRYVWQKA